MSAMLRGKTLAAAIICALIGISCTEPNPYLFVCGNGVIEAEVGEACDDGAGNGEGACSMECKLLGCGDSIVQATEECDHGENNADDAACTAFCTLASCGDGFVHAGVEECDDGAMNKETPDGKGGCTGKCETISICGDEIIDEDEDCDDANINDGDECPSTCLYPYCGDAIIQPGEGCDDGNQDDGDPCPSTCRPAKCLVDGTLVNGIDRTLSGEKINGYTVWTSNLPTGEAWEDKLDCENWSTSWPEDNGRQGTSGSTDETWTDDGFLTHCGNGGLLYCLSSSSPANTGELVEPSW